MKKLIARFKDRGAYLATTAAAATITAPSIALAQSTPVDFAPIIEAADWTSTVIPAVLAIAGAIAGVLVVVSGIKYVLGSIRRA